MAVLRIGVFGGRIPKLAPRLLPDMAAQQALNTRLTSGELRPWWKPKKIGTVPMDGARSVYRYEHKGERKLLAFRRPTHVVESALINDAHDRIYYSNADGFFVTTKDDIDAGVPASPVGVPPPVAPDMYVDVEGGEEEYTQTRVYVLTVVTSLGEESAPSAPVTASGPSDGRWTVHGLYNVEVDRRRYRNIEKLRLYRTITTATGVDYRLAREMELDALEDSVIDNKPDYELATSPVMGSLSWEAPPEGLQGVIAIAGGFNAGFKGRTVYFSEPYYPHSWPSEYQLAVEDDVVALGHFGNTVVIATKGKLTIAVGTSPQAMTLVTDGKNVPCVAAQSLVSTTGAVIFASEEGLVMVSDAGVQSITQAFISRDEWRQLPPENIKAAIYENRYLGFYSSSMGFVFQFDDPATAWTDVQHPGVTAVVEDATTSRTLLLAGRDVLEWEGEVGSPMVYSWRSKPMQIPKPANFGAMQIRGDFVRQPVGARVTLRPVESSLFDPLSLNVEVVNEGEPIAGPSHADAYSPGYAGVLVSVYGNGALRWQGLVDSTRPIRLPSGFKDDEIEVEISGTVPVSSVAIASTMKALETTP